MSEVTPSHSRGTVRKRGNRWQVDVMVAGRRVRRGAKTLDQAKGILVELTTTAGDFASPVTDPRTSGEQALAKTAPTVREVLQQYLNGTRLHCRPRTIRTTEAAVRRLSAFMGDGPVSELSRADVDRYTSARLDQGVGPHTPNRELACLRAALVQAKDDGLVERVPRIRMLRTVQALPRILSKDQIKSLVNRGDPLDIVFATAAGCGLRAAELRWLQWADVDFERPRILVRAKENWRPKTHAEREIPISTTMRDRLIRHHQRDGGDVNPWVFPVPRHGGIWSETGLSHAARRAAQRARVWQAGCKPLHDLRRSWASHLLAAGTPIDTVRRLGGWASNSTLERFYLAPTHESLERAVQASADLV